MIWYILYPFRGTTEPPRLSKTHPLRRAFQAHGEATARHWLLSIGVTIVVSVLLCYPALFQTDSPAANGLRNLPEHVWTSTTEVSGDRPADVEVRQVWVHGDYMKALEPRVLAQALRVQEALIGDGFEGTPGAGPEDGTRYAPEEGGCLKSNYGDLWGFHSPLMYWNCSARAIENDTDILATVNARSSEHSALGLALRPSTVFAGKAFVNKKLQAADALVITLFDKAFDQPKSNLGYTWEKRSRKLVEELGSEWDIYPADGQIFDRRLFEFRFKPMTLNDDLLLACSYIVTAVYVLWKMSQLRAVKSKAGLLITICAKMTICVIASFTICAYLGIDLARIPRPWFPGVFFCFGLGNIFRLINCVLETPPEMPPNVRIGHALGEVGHLSLAVAGQNLVLIYLCSRVVTPWVADFCVFAAVTLVLDFVFHLTFFVAVLSVDVQRMELQDSLERVELVQTSKNGRQERKSWISALSQGTGPVSTRFAGTAAILSMILAVNWHFFDSDSRKLNPRDLLGKISKRSPKPAPESTIFQSPPFNQARTPAEWFRIQDHNTAREMVGFIKPSSHSFVARVYDPLLVVMKGAKGRETGNKHQSLVEMIRHFAHDHAFPAALIAVSIIAVVTLLMNYLLWSGLPDESTDGEEDEERYFEVRTLPVPQTLDVVRLAACPKGHIASISLDKTTSLWLNDRTAGYSNTLLKTAKMKPKLWPIVASTLDDEGRLLAMASDSGQVGLWSIPLKRFLLLPTIDLRGQMPVLFEFFTQHNSAEQDSVGLVVVTPDGCLTMLDPRTGIHQAKQIGEGSVSAATLYTQPKGATHLVFVSKPGEVYILPLPALSLPINQWTPTPEVVAGLDPGPPPGKNPTKIKSIYGVPALGLIFAIRDQEIEIVEFSSRALIHSIKVGKSMKLGSFRVMHSSRRSCACGASAARTLVITYGEQDRDAAVLRTYALDGAGSSQICLGKSSEHGGPSASHNCSGWAQASETVHRVEPAGAWETTSGLSIIGVRRCEKEDQKEGYQDMDEEEENREGANTRAVPERSRAGKEAAKETEQEQRKASLLTPLHPLTASASQPLLSNNNHDSSDEDGDDADDVDSWQAYTLSHTGDFLIRPLLSSSSDAIDSADDFVGAQQLFVSEPGPVARLGGKSIAVGFGNTVKVISVGRNATAADARLAMGMNGSVSAGTIRGGSSLRGGMEMGSYTARGSSSRSVGRKIS